MAVSNTQIKKFINQFGELAVAECNRRIAEGKPFILPSVCMAQSALESSWGTAGIMTRANAFFGVKAGGSWTGKIYTADTWEVVNGAVHNITANFRAYDSPEESMRDYYELTTGASRYSKALSYGLDSSKWLTPRETVTALWAGGYATDDLYVQKIMNTLNGRSMDDWDKKIDGVTFSATVPDSDKIFTATDFVDGSYYISDGGRSIGITPDTGHLVLGLDKVPTIASTTTYKVNINVNAPYEVAEAKVNIYRLVSDTPTMDSLTYVNGDTFTANEGEKIYIELSDDSTPLRVGEGYVTLEAVTYSNGDEVVKSALAFFVEIK